MTAPKHRLNQPWGKWKPHGRPGMVGAMAPAHLHTHLHFVLCLRSTKPSTYIITVSPPGLSTCKYGAVSLLPLPPSAACVLEAQYPFQN